MTLFHQSEARSWLNINAFLISQMPILNPPIMQLDEFATLLPAHNTHVESLLDVAYSLRGQFPNEPDSCAHPY